MMKRHASLLFLAGLAFAAAIHGAEATFFAVNEDIYELHASPKDVLTFVRDKAEPSSLVGENGWMGELREGNGALLLSEDQRNGYLFVNGLLRKRLVDGREVPVKKSRPSIVGDEAVKTLWPPKAERLKADAAPRDFWAPGARLRLWFANPNLAGGLLAMGALAALGLVFCRRWRWRIAGILIAMLLLALLVKTESRASLLAFGGGCGLMALVRLEGLFSWKVLLPIVACGALACGYVALQRNSSRFTTEMFKEGDAKTSRVPIWKEVPRMMADAPWGWGGGESGKAYIRWYQKENTCLLENLVSGHCTFLVEHGWPLRFAYVFLWAFALAVLTRFALRGGNPMPLGVWGAFAFLGIFHPITYAWEPWSLAVGVLAFAASRRPAWHAWRMPVLAASCIAAIACMALFGIGTWSARTGDKVPVWGNGGAVALGAPHPETWIVDDDYVLHGGYWWTMGNALRKWCAADIASRRLGHAWSHEQVPPSCKRLVLAGEAGESFCKEWNRFLETHHDVSDIIFLSPSFAATKIPADLTAKHAVHVIQGGLAARLSGYQNLPDNVHVVPGAGLYVPNWLELASTLSQK